MLLLFHTVVSALSDIDNRSNLNRAGCNGNTKRSCRSSFLSVNTISTYLDSVSRPTSSQYITSASSVIRQRINNTVPNDTASIKDAV